MNLPPSGNGRKTPPVIDRGLNEAIQLSDVIEQLTARLQAGEEILSADVVAEYPEFSDRLSGLLPALRAVAMLGAAGDEGQPPNAELGDYRIVREVGRGGMGVVYEAEQLSLRRRVALKVLPFAATMDTKQLQRFRNEALAAASLHHEHIVPVYAVGCERGVHYYAMQFVDGRTLAQVIAEIKEEELKHRGTEDTEKKQVTAALSSLCSLCLSGKKSSFFRAVAELIADAADALEYAHSMGIVHRDVKPGNLMLDGAGKLWVTDFGLARFGPDAGLTMSGDLLGTLRYMAPEQALARHGLADHRVDVYGLGATLYELLTGKPAMKGADRQEILKAIAFEEPTPLRKIDKSIPAELETITLKALAKNPNERYASASELAADLRRWLADKAIRARRLTVRQRLARWTRRHPVLTAAVSLVAGLLIAGAWAWNREVRHAETAAQAVAHEVDQLRAADRLPEALQAARRAADLLPRFGGDAALRREILQRVADTQLLLRFDQARIEGTMTLAVENRFDNLRTNMFYQRAFEEYGIDIIETDEQIVIDHFRKSPIVASVVGALTGWACWTPDANQRKRLARLVVALDTDPRRISARVVTPGQLAQIARDAETDLASPAVLELLGEVLRRRSLVADSERLLRAAQKRYPNDFWINTTLASVLPPDQANEQVRFYTAALAIRPDSAGVFLNLGNSFLASGRTLEAVYAYRRATELVPDYGAAFASLSKALRIDKKYDDAEMAARRAVAILPHDCVAHGNLAFSLAGQGRHAEAETVFRQAIELKPDVADLYEGFGRVLVELKRYGEAESAFRRACELKPDNARYHVRHAETLGELSRLDEAEAACRRAVALDPKDANARYVLGFALESVARSAEAEVAYRQAIELKPKFAMAHKRLGVVLLNHGRLNDAVIALRRANELDPIDPEAYAHLGEVLCRLERYEDSLASFRRGRELAAQQAGNLETWDRDISKMEGMVALAPRLAAILAGKAQPNSAVEQLAIAEMCHLKKSYATAVQFYAAAFDAEPQFANDPATEKGYNAACAAALASTGQGEDATKLAAAEQARMRSMAIGWLTNNLAAWAKFAEIPTNRPKVKRKMRQWQNDPDLAGVRDETALAKLPDAERIAWQKFWADVNTLLKRTEQPPPANKPPP